MIRETLHLFIMKYIRNTVLGNRILEVLIKHGIDKKIYGIFGLNKFFRNIDNFSEEVEKCRLFFKEHENDIQDVCSILSDEQSKKVLQQKIKFLQTHDKKDRPEYYYASQYFDKEIVSITNEEVFLDCGSYRGDTVRNFIKLCHKHYKRIICFEPEPQNYNFLIKSTPYKNIKILKGGVWSETKTLRFADGNAGSSHIIQEEKQEKYIEVPVYAIDSLPECKDATFIKMDVEGSEMDALIGAKNTIIRNKPKMAICIYHSNEDHIRIAKWIHELKLDYKLYIRHHTAYMEETVLYAIP